MNENLKSIKVILCVLGIMFIVACSIDLFYSRSIISRKFSRPFQINMFYQVIFLISCLPFFIGVIYEVEEAIAPFAIVAPYSTLLDFILVTSIATGIIDMKSHNKLNILIFLFVKVILTSICTYFTASILLNIVRAKREEETRPDFKRTYAYQRFGGDSIIYGYRCGPSQVYYHESASTNAGLPPPADPMGLVQLKAKRRLERDHAIILL